MEKRMKEFGWWKLDENHTPQFMGTGVEVFRDSPDGVWKRVALTEVGPYRISTVFLGLDHSFDVEGPPILFETMVFFSRLGALDIDMDRYATWAEAEAGHWLKVEEVKEWGWKKRLGLEWKALQRRFGSFWRDLFRTRSGSLLG